MKSAATNKKTRIGKLVLYEVRQKVKSNFGAISFTVEKTYGIVTEDDPEVPDFFHWQDFQGRRESTFVDQIVKEDEVLIYAYDYW